MEWRFIDTGYDAFYNMAVDEALMQLSSIPTIRFYRWKPAALSIGYFQDIKAGINYENCKKYGIDVVRRITGGKAVLHDKEVTYSIVADESLMPKGIIESYKRVSSGIVIALRQMGIDTKMEESANIRQKSAICFNEPSYYELTVNGKKIAGSAQTRKNKKLLQHGSILIDIDFDKIFSVFGIDGEDKKISIKNRITSINNELKRKITCDEVKAALKNGFEENFGVKLKKSELTEKEEELANRLIKEKYSTDNWNLINN